MINTTYGSHTHISHNKYTELCTVIYDLHNSIFDDLLDKAPDGQDHIHELTHHSKVPNKDQDEEN